MSRRVIRLGGRTAAIVVLAAGGDDPAAAKAAGCSSRTIARWRAEDPTFDQEVREAQGALVRASLGEMASAAPTMVRRLVALAEQDKNLPVAVSAARGILENLCKLRGQIEIEREQAKIREELERLDSVVTLRLGPGARLGLMLGTAGVSEEVVPVTVEPVEDQS